MELTQVAAYEGESRIKANTVIMQNRSFLDSLIKCLCTAVQPPLEYFVAQNVWQQILSNVLPI